MSLSFLFFGSPDFKKEKKRKGKRISVLLAVLQIPLNMPPGRNRDIWKNLSGISEEITKEIPDDWKDRSLWDSFVIS